MSWNGAEWSDLTGFVANGNVCLKAFTSAESQGYTLTTSVVGSGTVTANPKQSSYPAGTQVTLTANPASGWQLSHWSGGASGSANPVTITMDADKTVTATFTASGGVVRIEQDDPSLHYQGTWNKVTNASYSGGSYAHTIQQGASVTLNFNGTAVDYIACKAASQGSAHITLDGVYQGSVSLYNPSLLRQVKVWGISGLSAGPHTLVITYGGSNYTNVDAFDVWS